MPARLVRVGSGSVLHVEDRGEGLPILALHGLGGGSWFFAALAARLGPGFQVIAPDLPGTGRSTSATPFTIESWVEDLHDLVRHGIGRPVVLLGHSMGAILALHAWAAWPHLICSMVFAGGLPEPRREIKERLARREETVARHGLAGLGEEVTANNFAAATRVEHPELVALFERLFESQDASAYVRSCHLLRHASATGIVGSVRVPSLSVVGSEDFYAPRDAVARFMDPLGETGRVEVLSDCGHYPFLERPHAFADTVKTFLAPLC